MHVLTSRPLEPIKELSLPRFLVPWIFSEASLTERLKALTGEANLIVVRQDWIFTCQWTQHNLPLNNEPFWQREVIISSQQKPCWYARTIIPQQTFYTYETLFARLKKDSLGDIIHNNPRIQRVLMGYYPIYAQSVEYDWFRPYVEEDSMPLWLRLAQLTIDECCVFFLYEIFLSGLPGL